MRKRWLWRWGWFAIGAGVFSYSLLTGRGLAGPMMSWEVERFHSVDAGYTYMLLFLALVFPPLAAVVLALNEGGRQRTWEQIESDAKRDGRRMIAAGAALWLLAGGAFGYALSLPDLKATPAVVQLDELSADAPLREGNTALVGVLQRQLELRYSESVQSRRKGTSSNRHILPITPSGWKPGQPIRFLLNTGGPWGDRLYPATSVKGDGPKLSRTSPGLLLRNSVPPYLRTVLAHRGLVLTEDAILHSGDPDAARLSYDVFAALGGFLGLMSILFGVIYLIKPGFDRRRGLWPPSPRPYSSSGKNTR